MTRLETCVDGRIQLSKTCTNDYVEPGSCIYGDTLFSWLDIPIAVSDRNTCLHHHAATVQPFPSVSQLIPVAARVETTGTGLTRLYLNKRLPLDDKTLLQPIWPTSACYKSALIRALQSNNEAGLCPHPPASLSFVSRQSRDCRTRKGT